MSEEEVIQEQPEESNSLLTGVEPVSDGPALERPEWVLDKYATEDRSMDEAIAEQAKAYVELQKQFGAFSGAPEEYEFQMPEGIEGTIDEELPLYGKFKDWAKSKNVSNDSANELFGMFVEYQNEMFDSYDVDLNAQKEMLGANADQRIASLASWAGNILDESGMAALETMTSTADQIIALEKLRDSGRNTQTIKTHEATNTIKGYSRADFDRDVNSEEFKNNPNFRAETRKKAQGLF